MRPFQEHSLARGGWSSAHAGFEQEDNIRLALISFPRPRPRVMPARCEHMLPLSILHRHLA